MNEQKNFWQKVLDLIIRLFSSSTKTQNSSESQKNKSQPSLEAVKSEIGDVAKDFIEEKAIQLGSDFIDMLGSLSPKQKEFAMKLAVIKSVDKSELTLQESIELGDVINEAARLNLEITEELSSFWAKVGDVALEVTEKFANIGIRVAAKAITAYIPI